MSRFVDTSNQYHLFVLSKNARMPLGLDYAEAGPEQTAAAQKAIARADAEAVEIYPPCSRLMSGTRAFHP